MRSNTPNACSVATPPLDGGPGWERSRPAAQFLHRSVRHAPRVHDALDIVEQRKQDEEKTALELWKEALSNVMPHVEVRSRRVGGATFQIPMPIRADRKISMAIKWMILYARKRNEKSMSQRLAGEILAAVKEEGAAVKKRVDVHKMADANKAFSHFRF